MKRRRHKRHGHLPTHYLIELSVRRDRRIAVVGQLVADRQLPLSKVEGLPSRNLHQSGRDNAIGWRDEDACHDTAILDEAKLTGYCLSPGHPRGKHKARVFAAVLGFTSENVEQLRAAARTLRP